MASSTDSRARATTPRGPEHQSPPTRPRSTGRKLAPQSAPPFERNGATDVVLIGSGGLAHEAFLPALATLQQSGALRVRAIVEPLETLREWASRFFPEAQTAGGLDAVDAPPDSLAILLTPARFHPAQALSAFRRGWHVLAGAPFAANPREGAQMIAAADREERLLAVDLSHRLLPAAQYLRVLCRDQLLGPTISFRIHAGTTRAARADAPPFSEKFEAPDGALSEVGAPVIDFLISCLGAASVRRYADDAMGGVEANALIQLSFPENVHGTLHLSRDWDTPQSATFVFERGTVQWDMSSPGGISLHLASAPAAVVGQLAPAFFPADLRRSSLPEETPGTALGAQLANIVAFLQGREPLRVSAADALPALATIEECYAIRAALPQPWLDPREAVQARAYAPPSALRRP